MLYHSGGTSQLEWLGERQESVALKTGLQRTSELWVVPLHGKRQARWHELLSEFDFHLVYTPGPEPVDDFLSF